MVATPLPYALPRMRVELLVAPDDKSLLSGT